MKYLCLICAEPAAMMEYLPDEAAGKHFDEYREFTEEIRRRGHLVACNRLLPASAAITVRVRDHKVSVTDGPFAETKEHLGGYYVIEAKDLNEAIAVAAKIPGARFGCVELRPIAEDERTRRALEGGTT